MKITAIETSYNNVNGNPYRVKAEDMKFIAELSTEDVVKAIEEYVVKYCNKDNMVLADGKAKVKSIKIAANDASTYIWESNSAYYNNVSAVVIIKGQ